MRYKYQGTFTDQAGNIIASGTISTFLAGTATVADVYTASAGGTAVNSVTSDSSGLFTFWVDTGDHNSDQLFKITLVKSGYSSQSYDNIVILPFASAGYTDDLKPQYIFGGASNTVGHTVPDAADDTFAMLAAAQTLTNKIISAPTEAITAASPTLTINGSTTIDSSSNAVNGTLGSGTYIGQIKTIVMTEASNSSTISITAHQTSDPLVATFDDVDETGVFLWTGTEWITLFATYT